MIHYLAQVPFPIIILTNLTYFYQTFFGDNVVYVNEITFYLRAMQVLPVICQFFIAIAHHQIISYTLKGKEANYKIQSHVIYSIVEFLILFSFSSGAYIFFPTCYVLTKQMFTKYFIFWVSPKPQQNAPEVEVEIKINV
jgi:hypothetical protein